MRLFKMSAICFYSFLGNFLKVGRDRKGRKKTLCKVFLSLPVSSLCSFTLNNTEGVEDGK